MRDPNVTSLYFAIPVAFNAPDGGVPVGRSPTILRKILLGGRRMAKVQNGEEILPKVSIALVGRTNVKDRHTAKTDGFAIAMT